MSRIPSVKTLESLCQAYRLPEPDVTARAIRRAMEAAHEAPTPPWPNFWGRPFEGAMDTINLLLGTCGVEYAKKGRNKRSPAFLFCNSGDHYDPTVILTWHRGPLGQEWATFSVGSWGDKVERGNYE